jgi:hypothetical protein
MRPLNTIPIENFVNKAKIASKSNQKNLTLTTDEAVLLADSITTLMARLIGKLEEDLQKTAVDEVITVNMDGGGLR